MSKIASPAAIRLAAVAVLGAAISFALWGLSQPADAQGNGVLLGAYAQPVNGQSNQEAFEKLEGQLGAKLPIIRAYSDWDDGVGQDKPLHRWARDGGRELMVSVKPKRDNGTDVPWNDITNAQPGSRIYGEMQALARGIKNYREPVIFTFHHEPEASTRTGFGDSDEYIAAYRKIHSVFAAEGVTNANWAWVMTEWSFQVGDSNPNDRRVADKWYPGDDVVDMIGSDTYNWNNCRPGNSNNDPWSTMEQELAPLMRFANKHPDKKLVLGEFASDEGSSGRKGEWMEEAQELFKTSPYKDRFAALLYFHDNGDAEGWPDCDWWLDSSSDSLQAASRWFSDGFFRGSLGSPPAPAPAPTTTTAAPPTTTTTAAPAPPATTTTTAAPATTTTAAPTPPATTTTTAAPNPPTNPTPTTTTAPPRPQPSPVDPPSPKCMGLTATIVGTSGNDTITGTAGRDIIVGLGGDDTINGLGGNDVICGGAGDDTINASGGADTVFGQSGADFILGGFGPDVLFGGAGADRINGQHGNDELFGEQGGDVLRGGPHQDTLRGGDHADRIYGQGGWDNIAGGNGPDRLFGGVGADRLSGGSGGDLCNGEAGNDRTNCERGRA